MPHGPNVRERLTGYTFSNTGPIKKTISRMVFKKAPTQQTR